MTDVRVDNLRVTFGSFTALKDVSLHVPDGSLVTLLGPSGCGKTTLLRSIAGIVHPNAGEIRFGGRVMNDVPTERRNIGMVFQTYALFPHMTVAKNLSFGLEMRRVPKDQARERIMKALALVELEEHADRYPRQLSGGQQQRVALARAIVVEPDVLLFDEPLSNLDAKLRESLREDLRHLQKRLGITSIYVTHDQAEAMALADHIVVMRSGEIVEEGAPEALYRQPRQRYVAEFLGHTNVIEASVGRGGLELPWGASRPAAQPLTDSAGTVLVSLRPEDIDISRFDASSAPGERPGTVEEVTFMGAAVQYKVAVEGQVVRVQVVGTRNAVLPVGTPVRLVPPPALHILQDSKPGETSAAEAGA